jgi:hypothetical protein
MKDVKRSYLGIRLRRRRRERLGKHEPRNIHHEGHEGSEGRTEAEKRAREASVSHAETQRERNKELKGAGEPRSAEEKLKP